MSSSSLHTCFFCEQVINSTVLAVFNNNPCCSECGLLASESNMKMQDDLASLFSKQMSMNPGLPKDKEVPLPVVRNPIVYSITQHYHHSSHVARRAPGSESMDLS